MHGADDTITQKRSKPEEELERPLRSRERKHQRERERQRKEMNAKLCVEETASCCMIQVVIQNEARAMCEV